MKILVWGMTNNLGGMEVFVKNYMSELTRYNITLDFISTTDEISIAQDVQNCGGYIYKIPSRKLNWLAYHKALKNILKVHANEYDAVWLNDCLFCNIDILKLAKKYNIKKRIIHAHNSANMGTYLQLLRHRFNLLFIRKYATDFWACSKKAALWSYPSYLLNKRFFRVIPNAIQTDKFSFDKKIRAKVRKELSLNNSVTMGFVGRFDYQKNPIFAMDVFCEYCKWNEDTMFLMIGDGVEREILKKRAKDLGIEDRVRFLGIRKDVADLMQAMDVLVMPSRFEGLGIVAIEAQASGLPTVISDVFPDETHVTNNLLCLDGNLSPDRWAEAINDYMSGFKRCDQTSTIKSAGYDIHSAAIKLVNYLKE